MNSVHSHILPSHLDAGVSKVLTDGSTASPSEAPWREQVRQLLLEIGKIQQIGIKNCIKSPLSIAMAKCLKLGTT